MYKQLLFAALCIMHAHAPLPMLRASHPLTAASPSAIDTETKTKHPEKLDGKLFHPLADTHEQIRKKNMF